MPLGILRVRRSGSGGGHERDGDSKPFTSKARPDEREGVEARGLNQDRIYVALSIRIVSDDE